MLGGYLYMYLCVPILRLFTLFAWLLNQIWSELTVSTLACVKNSLNWPTEEDALVYCCNLKVFPSTV